ncbi:BA75_02504T0 [Komagataella pastoris]|uniref:BA75_02504T0 n=1 Tax=Komagataella pastoris TaxID=4922 RepID=A0A1B2JCX1_PICPA|nr:BA75_02504T0 [Komagataella pastoris]
MNSDSFLSILRRKSFSSPSVVDGEEYCNTNTLKDLECGENSLRSAPSCETTGRSTLFHRVGSFRRKMSHITRKNEQENRNVENTASNKSERCGSQSSGDELNLRSIALLSKPTFEILLSKDDKTIYEAQRDSIMDKMDNPPLVYEWEVFERVQDAQLEKTDTFVYYNQVKKFISSRKDSAFMLDSTYKLLILRKGLSPVLCKFHDNVVSQIFFRIHIKNRYDILFEQVCLMLVRNYLNKLSSIQIVGLTWVVKLSENYSLVSFLLNKPIPCKDEVETICTTIRDSLNENIKNCVNELMIIDGSHNTIIHGP